MIIVIDYCITLMICNVLSIGQYCYIESSRQNLKYTMIETGIILIVGKGFGECGN